MQMPEQDKAERRLRELEETVRALQRRIVVPGGRAGDVLVRRFGRPYGAAWEYGHRTRRAVMSNRDMNSSSGAGMDFPDAVFSTDVVHIPVPNDWVSGTDITVNMMLLQITTAGSPLAVLNSDLSIEKDGDTYSDNNIENNVNISTTFTQLIVKTITRTVSGASVEAADKIQWTVKRTGGHASDTINGPLRFRSAWIEYTAFF